jgi:hypothetical protein
MVKSAEFQTKKNIWASEDMVRRWNKSELRRMVEQEQTPAPAEAPEPGLKLVKS